MDTVLTVTLVVKGDRRAAGSAAVDRLNAWFLEDEQQVPPYADGSLLWYAVKQ